MKKIILLGIIILSFIVQGNNQIFKSNSKEYFIIKGKNIVNQKRLVTSLDKSNSKYEILIGLDYPNGTILNLKNQENKKIIGNLLIDIPPQESLSDYFDNWGSPLEEVIYQVTVLDLNNDGEKEIILTMFNPEYVVGLVSYIWTKDRYIGEIKGGGSYMEVQNNHIIAPFGSQRLFEEYTLKNNRIVKTVN